MKICESFMLVSPIPAFFGPSQCYRDRSFFYEVGEAGGILGDHSKKKNREKGGGGGLTGNILVKL